MTCHWDALDWIFACLFFATGFLLYPGVRAWVRGLMEET